INKDDLGDVDDEFQDLFFEALAQRGIENYDRAIEILQESLEKTSDKPVIHYELGANYKSLKEYEEAESHFLKVLKERKDDENTVKELLEVYYENQDYEKGITLSKKWTPTHTAFNKNLAEFYFFN